LGRSIDRASRSRHSKFKPVDLGEIQAGGETGCTDETLHQFALLKKRRE
jgi:hypothetical protein